MHRKLRHEEGMQLLVAGGESVIQGVWVLQCVLEFCLLD